MKWPRPPQPPWPPRLRQLTPTPISETRSGPDKEIADARADYVVAQAEVEAISQGLLDRLLTAGVRQRFKHFDDPDLTPADRLKLRASVISSDESGAGWLHAAWSSVGDLAVWVFPRPMTLVIAGGACVLLAYGLSVLFQHNGHSAEVTAITRVVKQAPDGFSTTGLYGPGVRLVVERDGTRLMAREWVPSVGYSTYAVDPNAVSVQDLSTAQTIIAFARAIAAGWRQPVGQH